MTRIVDNQNARTSSLLEAWSYAVGTCAAMEASSKHERGAHEGLPASARPCSPNLDGGFGLLSPGVT